MPPPVLPYFGPGSPPLGGDQPFLRVEPPVLGEGPVPSRRYAPGPIGQRGVQGTEGITDPGAKAGGCLRSICIPDFAGRLPGAKERAPSCICWSDVIVYAAAVLMIGLGGLSILRR